MPGHCILYMVSQCHVGAGKPPANARSCHEGHCILHAPVEPAQWLLEDCALQALLGWKLHAAGDLTALPMP